MNSLGKHLRPFVKPVRNFLRMDSGATAMIFGIVAPVLLLAVGTTVDFGLYQRERTRLQGQVDAAAIASAREMQLARTDTQKVAAVA